MMCYSWKVGSKDRLFVRINVGFNGQKPISWAQWEDPILFPIVWTWHDARVNQVT
ncbi:hypothetical protein HanRHA438_Chr08g0339041 [Helianthus annuus]|uniref:Uncharacterized protein n=1 Tax=Helianthus annuus TaxID=4232 RepID=A0A9K3ICU7_HELAN|nr:hypothetical protein HanXRQr2_Chr08g0327851 [Helianthus annuus]KAJ0552691.1 hypothetical protein HanHA89_Chr08g0287981 [Helianthus annuus]KAJ0896838.1 hypothetical protein HanRHA438_Chr08g0339041 [Helianthus annuus]